MPEKQEQLYRKGVGGWHVKATSDPDVLEIIGSTEAKDSDGDIIRLRGWDLERYRTNPVFMFCHNYALPPLGTAERVKKNYTDKRLEFRVRFSQDDFAQRICALYKERVMRMSSVGFHAKIWRPMPDDPNDPKPEYARGKEFLEQELIELSAVPIGANPEALVCAITKGITTASERQSIQALLPPVLTETCPECIIEEIGQDDEALVTLDVRMKALEQHFAVIVPMLERMQARAVPVESTTPDDAGTPIRDPFWMHLLSVREHALALTAEAKAPQLQAGIQSITAYMKEFGHAR